MNAPTAYNDRVLTLIYRVEPGCLGPEGIKYVEDFCNYSNGTMALLGQGVIQFFFTPRYDKSRPEIEYRLLSKAVKQEQLETYFLRLGATQDEFEGTLGEKIAEMIEQFMNA